MNGVGVDTKGLHRPEDLYSENRGAVLALRLRINRTRKRHGVGHHAEVLHFVQELQHYYCRPVLLLYLRIDARGERDNGWLLAVLEDHFEGPERLPGGAVITFGMGVDHSVDLGHVGADTALHHALHHARRHLRGAFLGLRVDAAAVCHLVGLQTFELHLFQECKGVAPGAIAALGAAIDEGCVCHSRRLAAVLLHLLHQKQSVGGLPVRVLGLRINYSVEGNRVRDQALC